MKIDIKNDVIEKLKEMEINANEQTINSIVQQVYKAVIARDYNEIIEEAIEVENERRETKKTEDTQAKLEDVKEEASESTDNRASFEDPVKKDIQKNLLGGLFWWL